ncbi:polysaccharide biosynthesis/export family protein [Pelagicoccus sp. SDUM812002]|uniref:polysaccharide biosynthesis/export family protein n=1 Tax=Pelagicoccus sp. SDUM812002 TaxID=3041266 RepID=UPI0028109B5D|nr:polysaccharide biosynthesis/export family protein [Pelagicoccus sp. SDUM812002]MDQ8188181.1 polysaccharide export protein [Pelagicoccus sp. SDUM812002]
MNTLKTLLRFVAVAAALGLASFSTAQSGSENYKLKSGDVISLRIFQEPDMVTETRITAEGSVHFPLIGALQVAGKTLPELQRELFALYDADYFVNPQVSIQITEYAQNRIRVRGKVNKPGFVIIPPEEEFTLIDVITAAGDIASGGNEKKVELHRKYANGDTEVNTIDLSSRQGRSIAASLKMQNDDVVIVPEKLF